MKNILIFKTDKLGDFINISSIIINIKKKFPNCQITLICSNYNYPIAKHYSNNIKLLVLKKPFLFFLIKNFNRVFFKKYDLLLQLDGKSNSYLTSIFIRSKIKACIKFIKNKKILGKNILINRPNFFYNFFFNLFEISYEDYNLKNNSEFHYLTLYFKLLKKLNIPIVDNKHYLSFNPSHNISKFDKGYYFFQIDQRWEQFNSDIINNLIKKIIYLSKDNKIVIASNVGSNKVFFKLEADLSNNRSIELIKSPNINETLSLIYYSQTCVSSHSGLIVHSAAALKKNIIDLVHPNIFNELDRWIPFEINYKRFDINNFINSEFNFKY